MLGPMLGCVVSVLCLCCVVVVWKFPVYMLEVGLLNFFGLSFCCEMFVLFVVWKFPVCKLEVGLLKFYVGRSFQNFPGHISMLRGFPNTPKEAPQLTDVPVLSHSVYGVVK